MLISIIVLIKNIINILKEINETNIRTVIFLSGASLPQVTHILFFN